MKGKSMRIFQSLVLMGFAVYCEAMTLPLVPGSPAPNQGEQLPVELVEIGPNGAVMPQAIHRPAGRFILVVSNANQGTMETGVVIEPSTVGNLKLSATPLLRLGGRAVSDASHRSAALFAGTAGSFDLKDAVTGKILGKVVLH
jgi:hypothetical protein